MATLSVAHSAMESRTTDDSTWRDRSVDLAGKNASTRYKYPSTAFDFSGNATKIEFVLPYNDDSNTAFTTSLYVGNSSVDGVATIPSKCTKIGTFPSTIGDSTASGTLTLTITDATTINTFLTQIKSGLYIYIYGSNASTSTSIECKNSFRVNITYSSVVAYIYDGGWKTATPYVYNGEWQEATPAIYDSGWV